MCFRRRRAPRVKPGAVGLARDRGECVLSVVELPGDHVLDVLAERGVGAEGLYGDARREHRALPARVVLRKSSSFTRDEVDGCPGAADGS